MAKDDTVHISAFGSAAIPLLEQRIRELREQVDACQAENSRLKAELDATQTRLLAMAAAPFNPPRDMRED